MVWDFIVISRRLSDEGYGEIYTRNQKGLEWNWSEKDKNMTFRIWHSEYDIKNDIQNTTFPAIFCATSVIQTGILNDWNKIRLRWEIE